MNTSRSIRIAIVYDKNSGAAILVHRYERVNDSATISDDELKKEALELASKTMSQNVDKHAVKCFDVNSDKIGYISGIDLGKDELRIDSEPAGE